MENPYTKEMILRLIERKCESSKVDYKISYSLGDGKQKEKIKDILAMANTIEPDDTLAAMGFDPGYGFILIGIDDKSKNLVGMGDEKCADAEFQELIRKNVEPQINFLVVDYEHEVEGKLIRFGAIIIEPGHKPPYRLVNEIKIDQKVVLSKGYCPHRIGSSTTSDLTDAELEAMYRYRTRFSEAERILQRDEYHVNLQEQERLERIYVQPGNENSWRDANCLLETKHFLLIHGETGSGKRTMALKLAMDLLKQRRVLRILRASRYTDFATLRAADGAAIIIPDGFGLFGLERHDLEKDISLLEQIVEHNYVIITSTEVVLEEAQREPRMQEWDLLRTAVFSLSPESYSGFQKRKMIENHITVAVEQSEINPNQAGWIAEWLADDRNLGVIVRFMRRPLDIRRLVNEKLLNVSSTQNVGEIVRRTGSLDNEITTWFHHLDANHQCFLMTLALFQGVDQLGEAYSRIVMHLRNAFYPNLARLPVGIAGRACAPFVEVREDNTLSFTHPSYHEAILRIIATDYRDYFISLLDVFEQLSLPADTTDEAINASQPVREALAFAASQVAQHGIWDLERLLRSWAIYDMGRVRVPAADVLGKTAQNPNQRAAVLQILQLWMEHPAMDASRTLINQCRYMRWTAVVAYGRLSAVDQDLSLEGLRLLASDDRIVRSRVPRELQALVQARPKETHALYTQLAADSARDYYTRREVSRTMRFLSYRNPDYVIGILADWSNQDNLNRKWTLARICMIIKKQIWEQRAVHLADCLATQPKITAQALTDALNSNDLNVTQGWNMIRELVEYYPLVLSDMPILATVLEEVDSTFSWQCVERWCNHSNTNLRQVAALILVTWNSSKPEKAAPLLEKLQLDPDPNVVKIALLEPVIIIRWDDLVSIELDDEEDREDPQGENPDEPIIRIDFGQDDALGNITLDD